jgi:hypothetical protein
MSHACTCQTQVKEEPEDKRNHAICQEEKGSLQLSARCLKELFARLRSEREKREELRLLDHMH